MLNFSEIKIMIFIDLDVVKQKKTSENFKGLFIYIWTISDIKHIGITV